MNKQVEKIVIVKCPDGKERELKVYNDHIRYKSIRNGNPFGATNIIRLPNNKDFNGKYPKWFNFNLLD